MSGDCETRSLIDGVSETCAVGDEFADARLERDAVVLDDCDALGDSVANDDTDCDEDDDVVAVDDVDSAPVLVTDAELSLEALLERVCVTVERDDERALADGDPVDSVVVVSLADDEDDADKLKLAVAETDDDALGERDSAHDTI